MKNLITIPALFTIILQQQKTIYNYITIAKSLITIILQQWKPIYSYITIAPFTIVLQ
jgi:hypothetical protein